MEKQNLMFLLNKNLDFPIAYEPWTSLFREAGMNAKATTDIPKMNQLLIEEGSPNMAYFPGAGFCAMERKGNPYYRGLVIATSKFSGPPPTHAPCGSSGHRADKLDELEGSTYGYLNRSCSSSFFRLQSCCMKKERNLKPSNSGRLLDGRTGWIRSSESQFGQQ